MGRVVIHPVSAVAVVEPVGSCTNGSIQYQLACIPLLWAQEVLVRCAKQVPHTHLDPTEIIVSSIPGLRREAVVVELVILTMEMVKTVNRVDRVVEARVLEQGVHPIKSMAMDTPAETRLVPRLHRLVEEGRVKQVRTAIQRVRITVKVVTESGSIS